MLGWNRLAMLGQRVAPKLVAARLGGVRPAYPTQAIRQYLATTSSPADNEHVIVACM